MIAPTARLRHIDILRSIAIILVVIGHVGAFPGLEIVERRFPIYCYHMALFFFVSGYLFRDMEWGTFGRFVWRKTKTLALPLIGWNIVYAGIVSFLSANAVTNYLPPVESIWTAHNLFVEPFLTGHQYYLNLATWFIGVLYVAMLVYGFFHLLTKRLPDWALLIIYALLAGLALYSARFEFFASHYWLIPQRACYALFFIQLGRCFRRYIEPLLTPNRLCWITLVVFLIWWASLTCEWRYYVLVFMNFEGYVIRPLCAGALGCLFWAMMSMLIARKTPANRLERLLGANTWSIMMHHLLVRFLIIWLAVTLTRDAAQIDAFRNDFWYRSPAVDYWIYVAAMIVLPIIWQVLFDRLKSFIPLPEKWKK